MPTFNQETDYVIPVRTDRGQEGIAVRWPADDEWAEWYRTRPTMMTGLGRGANTFDTDDSGADAKLYERIRRPDAPALDPAEAHEVVAVLNRFIVRDIASEGDELQLTVAVMGGDVTHRVRIPTAKQVAAFRRGAGQMISLPFNKARIVTRIDAGVKLYNECLVKTGGYEGDVPAVHRDSAIRAALMHIENEADPENP